MHKLATTSVLTAAVIGSSFVVIEDAEAATLRYRASGDWSQITDGTSPGWGPNPNGVGTAVPAAGDTARINFGGNTVTVTTLVPTTDLVQIAVDESGTLVIDNGGSLSTNGRVVVGNNGGAGAAVVGTLNILDGGTLNVGSFLEASRENGVTSNIDVQSGGTMNVQSEIRLGLSGTTLMDISGTVFQESGTLRMGRNVVNMAVLGGTATVNLLDGGEWYLNDVAGTVDDGIAAGSAIDFAGGELFLEGDRQGTAQDYIDAGRFISVEPDFFIDVVDVDGVDYTRVATTAIPEPTSAVAFGAGVIGFAMRRRRRN